MAHTFLKQIPNNSNFINKAPARTILEFLKYSPSRYTKNGQENIRAQSEKRYSYENHQPETETKPNKKSTAKYEKTPLF